MSINFSQNAAVVNSGQSLSFSSLLSQSAGGNPEYVVVSILDRNEYTASSTGVRGALTGNGQTATLNREIATQDFYSADLVFTYTDQGYYNSTYGYLSNLTMNTSTDEYRNEVISMFGVGTAGVADSKLYSNLTTLAADTYNNVDPFIFDSSYVYSADSRLGTPVSYLGSLDVITRTNFVDQTPNQATASEIAAIAASFVGKTWNNQGCWVLANEIAASAGASLPATSDATRVGATPPKANGEWYVAYNSATATAAQKASWMSQLRTGDEVVVSWFNGEQDCGGHIATVAAGSGFGAQVIDNSGAGAKDGSGADIIIQGAHSAQSTFLTADADNVVIYRLDAPVVTVKAATNVVAGGSVALSSLFSAADPAGRSVVSYQVYDANAASGGSFSVGGVVRSANSAASALSVSAAAFGSANFMAGSATGSDTLQVRAFNGSYWGDWQAVSVGVGATPSPPVVTAKTDLYQMHGGTSVALTTLFSATSQGPAIDYYTITDPTGGGRIQLNGAVNLLGVNGTNQGSYKVSAADFAKLTYVAGSQINGEELKVAASNGSTQWSNAASVSISTIGAHAQGVSHWIGAGSSIAASTLVNTTEIDGTPITSYTFYDPNGGGSINLHGATNLLASSQSFGYYSVSAADLSKVTYDASASAGYEFLSIWANDGASSNTASALITTVAQPAMLSAKPVSVAVGGSLAVSSLVSVVPGAGAISYYRILDPTGGGSIQLNGATNTWGVDYTAQGRYSIMASDLSKLTYVAASSSGLENLTFSTSTDGSHWSPEVLVSVTTTLPLPPPTVSAAPASLGQGQSLLLSSLASATAQGGGTISRWRVTDVSGLGSIQLNGAVNLASPSDAANGIVLVSAADFTKLGYRAPFGSKGSDSLTIEAFDGAKWGSASTSITTTNTGPTSVAAAPATVYRGDNLALTSLFSARDADGNTITRYRVSDPSGLGSVKLNGAANLASAADAANGIIIVSAADFAKLTYQSAAGSYGSEQLSVAAFDGMDWSAAASATITSGDRAPVTTGAAASVSQGGSLALGGLLAGMVSDADSDAITRYRIADPSGLGSIQLNGAVNLASAADAANGIVIVSAADAAKLTYTVPRGTIGSEALSVRAYDGTLWGTDAALTITAVNRAPVVTATNAAPKQGQSLAVSALFSVSDADNDQISRWRLSDPAGHGSIQLNGAVNLASASDAASGIVIVSGTDFAKLSYVGGGSAGSEVITAAAWDGLTWSNTAQSTLSLNLAPVVAAASSTLKQGVTVAVSSLFAAATDANGDAISQYRLVDPSGQGSIQLNGAKNLASATDAAKGVFIVSSADITKLTYVAGSDKGSETLSVSAYDGKDWGAASSVVVTLANRAAVVAATSQTLLQSQKVSLSTLFSASDADGDKIVQWRVTDPAGQGSIQLNGAANLASAADAANGVFVVSAADFAKLTYTAGSDKGSEIVTAAAWDGKDWGAATGATITLANRAPVVATAASAVARGQSVALSSIASASDPDGDAVVQWRVSDPSGLGSVQLNGANNLASAADAKKGVFIVSASDFAKLTYVGAAASNGSETLSFQAWDGKDWCAAVNAQILTDTAAVVSVTQPAAKALGKSVALSGIVSATDADGDKITQWELTDPAGLGTLTLAAGGSNLATAAQKAAGVMVVSAADLAKVSYVAGSGAGTETIAVRAFDSMRWSDSVGLGFTTLGGAATAFTSSQNRGGMLALGH